MISINFSCFYAWWFKSTTTVKRLITFTALKLDEKDEYQDVNDDYEQSEGFITFLLINI